MNTENTLVEESVSTPAATAIPKQPETITYYGYDLLKGSTTVGASNGKVYVMQPTDTQPTNTIKWKPPLAAEGQLAYFIEYGWCLGKANITDDEWLQAYLEMQGMKLNFDTRQLQNGYSATEVATWQRQETDAKAYLANQSITPFLQSLADSSNKSVADLATSIVTKADAYNSKVAALLGANKANAKKLKASQVPIDGHLIQHVLSKG